MRDKTPAILLLCAVACTLAAAFVGGFQEGRIRQGKVVTNDHPTQGAVYFVDEVPPADPLIVGRWTCTANPQWHKVYYDDFDEEECLYWGKEWDEKEDVLEEDLDYHGNGWFRWEKKGDQLHEYATMSIRSVPIHHAYDILVSTTDSLIYREPDYKKNVYRFGK